VGLHTHEKHRRAAEQEVGGLRFGVITVSSSRYRAKMKGEQFSDQSAENAVRLIEAAGFSVASTKVVDDDVHMIRLNVLKQLFEKSLSEVGSAAVMTRSTGGIIGGRLVFSLPGAPEAATTGLNIILSEVKHLYSIANKQ